MKDLEKRYQEAIGTIGHARLLSLPDDVKQKLIEATDLEEKVKLLEEIAKNESACKGGN